MDGSQPLPEGESNADTGNVSESGAAGLPAGPLRRAQVRSDDPAPVETLARLLGSGPFDTVFLFVSPKADFSAVATAAHAVFPEAKTVACTTAGEIGRSGYEEDQIVAVALPRDLFHARTMTIAPLDDLSPEEETGRMIRLRLALRQEAAQLPHSFAFLLVDGLSLREDELAAALSAGLGPTPLFGGSAGDGTNFRETRLALNGTVLANAAVVTLVQTRCPVRVFSLDHLRPTDMRMVVTRADPARRIVTEINAEPAAREYARILGKDPHQLDPFTFAAHPVAVRLGGRHHVRAIQRVTDDGELVFFSAIDEGMVLSLAEATDMTGHLESELGSLGPRDGGPPPSILACDCILRRLEAGQKQQTRAVSRILSRHGVVGFSTYGEQIGPLHVNQTLTGVAIYPPDDGAPSPTERRDA